MSAFIYNEIALPLPYLTEFSQNVVYDDSDTDWVCTRFNIGVQTIINVAYLPMIAPDLMLGANPADLGTPVTNNLALIIRHIRHKLLQPRKLLIVSFNGINLLPNQPLDPKNNKQIPGTVDSQNGPKPRSCVFTQLTDTTFLLVYRITADYWENNTNLPGTPLNTINSAGNNVISNRWTEAVEMDACMMTTRRRSGKYVIRSDNVGDSSGNGFIADQMRKQMAVTSVPIGFTRRSAQYVVDPSGLGIQYSLVDVENFKQPPPPAFEAEGEYTETTTTAGGIRHGEVRVRLKGAKNTDQGDLIKAAVFVASQKLLLRGGQITTPNGKFGLLEGATVRMGLYTNTVECVIRCMYATDSNRVNTLGGPIAAFNDMNTTTPLSFPPDNQNYVPRYKELGTASVLLRAARYYDPSLSTLALDASDQLNSGFEVGQAGEALEP